MFLKQIWLVFLVTLFFLPATATGQVKLIKEIKIEGQFHTTDYLGNIYISNGPGLTRFSVEGNITGEFRSTFPGNITFIDASNPLQILLFYKEYNQVIFLDRNLIEKGSPFHLSNLGISNSELVCTSARGGIWVLDGFSRQVNYLNQEFLLLYQISLPGNLSGEDDIPIFMTESEGRLLISFSKTGILTFDRFGSYLFKLPLTNISIFQKTNQNFVLVSENKIFLYSPETKERIPIDIFREVQLLSARIEGNHLFVFTSQECLIYKIN